jgi:hypothetical protein
MKDDRAKEKIRRLNRSRTNQSVCKHRRPEKRAESVFQTSILSLSAGSTQHTELQAQERHLGKFTKQKKVQHSATCVLRNPSEESGARTAPAYLKINATKANVLARAVHDMQNW